MLSILPTFGAKPSTGFAFGVAANLAVYFGEPATTPISSAIVSGSFSTKKQTSVLARVAAAGSEDRRRLVADYRFQWTSQDTFGLGTSTGADDGVNARFTYIRLFQTAYCRPGQGDQGRRRGPLRRALRHPARRGRGVDVGAVVAGGVLDRQRPRAPGTDLGGLQPQPAARYPRPPDQRVARLVRQPVVPPVFQGRARRRLGVAGAAARPARLHQGESATAATSWRSGSTAIS